MAEIRTAELRGLLLESGFAPVRQRLIQLDACEALVRLIEPGGSYPFEFVCFHITGYRPRRGSMGHAIEYEELAGDLTVYASELSRGMDIPVSSVGQRVYTVEGLCRRWGVCRKTIQRWRREGLIGRYYRFGTGRRRLGFLASTVRDFRVRREGEVGRAGRFSQIGRVEREAMLRRLARWAVRCPERRQEAISRTARRFGRSVEAVRGLLVRHEDELQRYVADSELATGGSVSFAKRVAGVSAGQRSEIAELFEKGASIVELMERFGRSRSNIYRAITLARAHELAGKVIEYIGGERFGQGGLEAEILVEPVGLLDGIDVGLGCCGEQGGHCSAVAGSASAYAEGIAGIAVLSGGQESFLFGKYNYLKFCASKLQQQIDLEYPQGRVLKRMRERLSEAQGVRDVLIRHNLRLVVSVARKHTRDESEMLELISEGNVTLMNAVEKFDFSRGFKFSTYATWAIVKRFATRQNAAARRRETEGADDLLEGVSEDQRLAENRVMEVESARRELDEAMGKELEGRELRILRERYGFSGSERFSVGAKGKSFRQIGELLGLSKERIRQIEAVALEKLRSVLCRQQFDLLAE